MQSDKVNSFTIKVIGNQWFWTYSNFVNFDYLNNQSIKESDFVNFKSRYNSNLISYSSCPESRTDLFKVISFFRNEGWDNFYLNYFNNTEISRIPTQDNFFYWDLYFFYYFFDSLSFLFLDDLLLDSCLKTSNRNSLVETNFQYIKFQRIFESNLIPSRDLLLGDLRLLEVDQRLILPRNVKIRFLVTSTDVLHSWSIPSLGIKVDACPGRINEVHTNIYRKSIFYGQCSEICGILHGFMPIVIQTVSLLDYLKYSFITSPFKL